MANRRFSANIVIGGSITGSLRQAFQSTSKSLVQMGQDVRRLSTEQRTLERSIQTFGRMGKDVDGLRQKYASVTKELERMRAATERLQRVENARQNNLTRRGELRGQLMETAALAMAAWQPVRIAMDFEASMSKVASVSRASGEELASLTKQARDLGASTVWSASQAAEGMTFLAMAGFKTNEIMGAMPGMLSLASAGGLELGRAADIASNILTGFNLQAEEMGRVSDVMTNAFTASNVSVEMLGDTMKYVAPVAASLGVSLEQAAAMTGKLGDAGIQGSMAGTALRAILGRMAAPPKAAAEALDELGIKTKDAAGNMRDVPTILAEISAASEKLGNAKTAELFKAIAGDEAFSALTILVDQAGSGALQQFAKDMEEVGSAQRVAKQMTDNARGSLVEMQSAMESLAITVGNVMLPAVREGAGGITRLVSVADKLVQEFPMVAKGVFAVTSALVGAKVAAVAGGYAFTFLKGGALAMYAGMIRLSSGLRAVVLGARAMSMALLTNPIGLVAAGIVAAGIWIYREWDRVKSFFTGLWSGLTEGLAPVRERLASLAESVPWIGQAFDIVSGAISTVVDWFGKLFTPVQHTTEQLAAAGQAGQTAGEWIARGIEIALVPMMKLIDAIQWVTDNLGGMVSGVKDMASAGMDRVTGWWDGAKSAMGLGGDDSAGTPAESKDEGGGWWDGAKSWFGFGEQPQELPDVAVSQNTNTYQDNSQTTIQVTQQPGEDADALARRIVAEQERQRAIRERAALNDGAYAQ